MPATAGDIFATLGLVLSLKTAGLATLTTLNDNARIRCDNVAETDDLFRSEAIWYGG